MPREEGTVERNMARNVATLLIKIEVVYVTSFPSFQKPGAPARATPSGAVCVSRFDSPNLVDQSDGNKRGVKAPFASV